MPPQTTEQFWTAIESCDYAAAGPALDEYLTWFRSAPRAIDEVEAARNLLEWALQTARAAKLRMVGEMTFLT